MGKLLILLMAVVALAVVLVWIAAMLRNRQERSSLGLRGSKKRMQALESRTDRLETALREIRDSAASANPFTRDPALDYILDQANQALDLTDTEDTK